MTENRPIEGAARDIRNTMAHVSNSIENRQIEESNNIRCTFSNISPETFNLGARTTERSRLFANNISSTIEGICPLIQQAAVRATRSLSY